MDNIKLMGKKTIRALKTGGIRITAKKIIEYIEVEKHKKFYTNKTYKDVLFINGCPYNILPHPPRYRIQHQMEQLKANNIECDECLYSEVSLDQVRYYRVFIIFRCPYTESIGEFVKCAKELNKVVIYDIDDLVIDTKYTNIVRYLDTMTKEERLEYDMGVNRMQKLLKMCDAAITTTERMAEELSNYCSNVFINRNTASDKMLELSELAFRDVNKKDNCSNVKLAYFSGSITHNTDFQLITPVIERLMEEYSDIELHIVGILDIPEELQRFSERIIAHSFIDWHELPRLIASMDINLAPLENNIFNEAKSENKWVEAALVRVPTVASKVGAFEKMIENHKNGILCESMEDWYQALKELIIDKNERKKIAQNAYNFCKTHCVTLYSGNKLKNFIKEVQKPNIAFILPSLNISGGIMVAFEHCRMMKESGYDVVIINHGIDAGTWFEYKGVKYPVLPYNDTEFRGTFDKAVATMWTTVSFLEEYENIKSRYYLVQGFETDLYEPGVPLRLQANRTYSSNAQIQFVTISKWCQKWLLEEYGQESRYSPNGIHNGMFPVVKRKFEGKIRILIEGDCEVNYKNIDESFRIANRLDKNKYEIWYMSYNAKPKSWYQVDRFLHKIPFEKVHRVYQKCHILLKTSILESFSYPPLEMMSTGGFVVVVSNEGNKEYLKDNENCLLYPAGNIDAAIAAIQKICEDASLRERLYEGGLNTARGREWANITGDILKMYGGA